MNVRIYRSELATAAEAPSGPKGFRTIIKRGRRVKAATRAIVMANPVNSPKRIVGIKFDRAKMEKPTIIVREV